MNDILVEFDKYISSNKDVLSVLPINTKKNNSKISTIEWENDIDNLVYYLYGLTEDEIRVVEGE